MGNVTTAESYAHARSQPVTSPAQLQAGHCVPAQLLRALTPMQPQPETMHLATTTGNFSHGAHGRRRCAQPLGFSHALTAGDYAHATTAGRLATHSRPALGLKRLLPEKTPSPF